MSANPKRVLTASVLIASALSLPLAGLALWRFHEVGLTRHDAVESSSSLDRDEACRATSSDAAISHEADARVLARRPERLGVRDVLTYLALLIIATALLLVQGRRRVAGPMERLQRLLQRIADGDLDTRLNLEGDGGLASVAETTRDAFRGFVRREEGLRGRVAELRNLVRRLLDELEQPVIVIGADKRVDYVNDAAARALGENVEAVEGKGLSTLPGGEALAATTDEILSEQANRCETEIQIGEGKNPLSVRCTVVRDSRGQPARVVMMLAGQEDAGWWARLVGGTAKRD